MIDVLLLMNILAVSINCAATIGILIALNRK